MLQGAAQLLKSHKVTFVIFEIGGLLEPITRWMNTMGYLCFIMSPLEMWPVSPPRNSSDHHLSWWYPHLNNVLESDPQRNQHNNRPKLFWGNGVCGIRNSESLEMLWRMYHSNSEKARRGWHYPPSYDAKGFELPLTSPAAVEAPGHKMHLADAFHLL